MLFWLAMNPSFKVLVWCCREVIIPNKDAGALSDWFNGPHIHVVSASTPLRWIFKDLTERSEISWPANPADQAFVTGAGWPLFGEGLALPELFGMISGI